MNIICIPINSLAYSMPSSPRYEPYFLNEDAIMADFRTGEREAFRYIFDQLSRELTYFVENITNSLEAEDIVANSFSKLYQARENMKSLDHVEQTLFVMAKNESIDFLKRKSRYQQSDPELLRVSQEEEDHLETERVMAACFQAMLREIEKSPGQYKRIKKLFLFEPKRTNSEDVAPQ